MNVSVGDFEFEWLGDWAELPSNVTVERGWSHHGMAFSSEGQIVTFHPAGSLPTMTGTST